MLKTTLDILSKAVVKDIIVYNMQTVSPFYDYFVIGSVNSNRQGNAAVNYLKKDLAEAGYKIKGFSSSSESGWFLVDAGEIVVHIFVGNERSVYNLDGIFSHLEKNIIED